MPQKVMKKPAFTGKSSPAKKILPVVIVVDLHE
jgi:hypothetical protein